MARFFGTLQGQRGGVTRLGGPSSGMTAEARGWDVGGRLVARADGDADVIEVHMTGGSNGGGSHLVGTIELAAGGRPVFHLAEVTA